MVEATATARRRLPSRPPPPVPTAAPTPTTDEDWEEVAGASAPLYELVGVVFELHTRGFFRRQVFGVARQALALVAGGAVDDWLLRRLRTLSSPTTVAGLLLRLQGSLWPGGVWYSRAAAVAATREREAAGSPPPPLGPDGRPPLAPTDGGRLHDASRGGVGACG